MDIEIKGVHYDVSDTTKDFINKKLKRIGYAKDLVTNLLFTIKKEKKSYKVESNLKFRWGQHAHLGTECIELYKGIEILVDKLEQKVTKEKARIQEHKVS